MDIFISKLNSLDLTGLSQDLGDYFLSNYFAFNQGFWDKNNIYQLAFDALVISFLLYIVLKKPQKDEKPLTEKEKQVLIEEWEPEPLFTPLTPLQKEFLQKVPVISGVQNENEVIVDGKPVLNLSRINYHGFVGNPQMKEAAVKAIRKYGVGTCGPRGFYGTLDAHLDLEKRICEFMQVERAVIYSFGFATISSPLSAFAGRGDLLLVDKGINFALQTGVFLSRATTIYYEHNDMQELERIMKEIQQEDRRKGRKLTRRFVIFEGVSFNYGDIAPLDKIVELKNKYKWRLFMDDSNGIGVIGRTGRGTCEYRNVDPNELEVITGNLSNITTSEGGFCLGDKMAIYHQRLNSAGYVYSASLPPLLSEAAKVCFDIFDSHPENFQKLQKYTDLLHEELADLPGLKITSSRDCPIIHLRLTTPSDNCDQDEIKLQEIVDEALQRGLLLTRAIYSEEEKFKPPPSLRLPVSLGFSENQWKEITSILREITEQLFSTKSKKNKKSKPKTKN